MNSLPVCNLQKLITQVSNLTKKTGYYQVDLLDGSQVKMSFTELHSQPELRNKSTYTWIESNTD